MSIDSCQDQCEEVSKSEASDHSKGVRCQLLDWCSEDDVVVGEGEFCSAEQWYKIGRIPLGRHAAAVIVKSVSDETASLWRPTPSVFLLGEALGTKIAWPFDKIILDNDADSPIENKTAGSSVRFSFLYLSNISIIYKLNQLLFMNH